MEANKEEAFKAIEVAEKRFAQRDFAGARNYAVKARTLCPDLEEMKKEKSVTSKAGEVPGRLTHARAADAAASTESGQLPPLEGAKKRKLNVSKEANPAQLNVSKEVPSVAQDNAHLRPIANTAANNNLVDSQTSGNGIAAQPLIPQNKDPDVVNIDADFEDPQICSHYAVAIYDNFRIVEVCVQSYKDIISIVSCCSWAEEDVDPSLFLRELLAIASNFVGNDEVNNDPQILIRKAHAANQQVVGSYSC